MNEQDTSIFHHCEADDILTCSRYIMALILAILTFILASYLILKFYKQNQKFSFEMLPMLTCALQALLHIIQYSLINNNIIAIVTNYIQIITFAFLGNSFMYLYFKISNNLIIYKEVVTVTSVIYFGLFLALVILIPQIQLQQCTQQLYINNEEYFGAVLSQQLPN
ncbi:hypothetical protein pb186bvf_016793 [Paramecium bursaria]